MHNLKLSSLAGIALISLGIVVVVGWLSHEPSLVQLAPGFAAMSYQTAIGFVIAGVALLHIKPVQDASSQDPIPYAVSNLLAGLLVALGIVALAIWFGDIGLGTDQDALQQWLMNANSRPERMRPLTAGGFAVFGLAIMLFNQARSDTAITLSQVSTLAVMGLGLLAVIGPILGIGVFRAWYGGMPLHAGAGFLVCGLGLLSVKCRDRRYCHYWRQDESRKINLVGAAIIAVTGLIGVFGGFAVLHPQAVAELENGLQLSLKNRSDRLQSALEQNWQDSFGFANQPLRVDSMKMLGRNPQDQAARANLRKVAERASSYGFSAVIFRDLAGREVARVGAFAVAPELEVAINTGTPSALLWDHGFVLHARVDMLDGDTVVGTMEAERPLRQLGKDLHDTANLGQTTDFAVCAPADENMHCFPFRSTGGKVLLNLKSHINGQLIPMSYALAGKTGVIHTRDYRKQEVIAAYAPLGNLRLGTVLKIDSAELYQPITSRLGQLVIVLLGLTAVGVALLRLQVLPLVRKMASEIKERKRTEAELFAEKERALVTLHCIADGVIVTDVSGRVQLLNPIAEALTGWLGDEAKGKPVDEIYRLVDASGSNPELGEADAPGEAKEAIYNLIRRGGEEIAVQHSAAAIRNREGEIIGRVMVFRDVTEARELAEKLSWQVKHDPLTGLANRIAFELRLGQLLASARTQNQKHVLLYLDLDQFKVVNDTCGHMAGDELLGQIAVLLGGKTRRSDLLARLGGDEFAILLEGCDIARGEKIAQGICDTIAAFKYAWQDKNFAASVSIGIVEIGPESESAAVLLSAADTACYVAKNEGRNRVERAEINETSGSTHSAMQWVSRIGKALDEGHFRLYCQQIVPTSSSDRRERHFELLLRMANDDGTITPPGAFVPAAERFGIMAAVDRWVILNAFKTLAMYPVDREGCAIQFSINLSVQSLNESGFLDFVLEQLKQLEMPLERICFEITETAAVSNLNRVKKFIAAIRQVGCRFALDDFGSGMSSYSYLKNLEVDYLKIDGTFVKDMLQNPVDLAMVESINRIGHVMGIKTIAEFVETEAIFDKLGELGIDYAQGYALHRPEPLQQVLDGQYAGAGQTTSRPDA